MRACQKKKKWPFSFGTAVSCAVGQNRPKRSKAKTKALHEETDAQNENEEAAEQAQTRNVSAKREFGQD